MYIEYEYYLSFYIIALFVQAKIWHLLSNFQLIGSDDVAELQLLISQNVFKQVLDRFDTSRLIITFLLRKNKHMILQTDRNILILENSCCFD